MKFIALLTPRPGTTEADFLGLRLQEERRVWQLYTGDIIRELYFQPDPLRVALQFEADSVEAVDEHLATLPMVAAGLFDRDIIHLGPWLPFAALFSQPGPGDVS